VLTEQSFANTLPEPIAVNYEPPFLHDETLVLLTAEQRRQARAAAEQAVRELKEALHF
jgi:hypothetical protein